MRYFILIIITIISIFILWINIQLYSENFSNPENKADIILQLNFLESEIKQNNLGERMQQIFPEGIVFVNALYGLAWCELILADSINDNQLKKKAINEALVVYNTINSDRVKSIFDKELSPEYGIFYQGWRNYLLSKIICIDSTFDGCEIYLADYKTQCDLICDALKKSASPYLHSYYSQSWPADMFVAMASLSIHDRIFKPEYEKEIQIWIEKVKKNLDPITLMIPHEVNPSTGESIFCSRGSSMSLILSMLPDIDNGFAKEQFELYNKNFVSSTFGLPSITEFPKGQSGPGDIDSGPVIFGVGFSATIAAINTMSHFITDNLKEKLYKTVNAFGFTVKNKNQKKYLFGKLPLADAFIAWGRATNYNHTEQLQNKSVNWRFKFHFTCILVIITIWITAFLKKIIKSLRNAFRRNSISK